MVGTNTALIDNPQLTARKVKGKNPIRVVIDKNLKIPSRFHLFDGNVPTLVFTSMQKKSKKNLEYIRIDFQIDALKKMLHELYKRQIQSLLVEGGAKLLNSFISENLWDETRIFTSQKKLIDKNRIPSPLIKGKLIFEKRGGVDSLKVFRNIS